MEYLPPDSSSRMSLWLKYLKVATVSPLSYNKAPNATTNVKSILATSPSIEARVSDQHP